MKKQRATPFRKVCLPKETVAVRIFRESYIITLRNYTYFY